MIKCLTNPQSLLIWSLKVPPVLDAYPGTSNEAYAFAQAYSHTCSSLINSNISHVGQYVSTPYTARDMLEISRQIGQPKLHYWGFSYGTFLGVTFASLFPSEVGKLVLDGNVDAVEYSVGILNGGTGFLNDTDKVMNSFYTLCHRAGLRRCPFYDMTPAAIEKRLDTLLANIKLHPVVVPGSSPGERPEIVSYSTVRRVISMSLYRPILYFPLLAKALLALESGNGLPFLTLSGQGIEDSLLCGSEEGQDLAEGNSDASAAILCSDNGGWPKNSTVLDFGLALADMQEKSKSMARQRLE